MDVILMGLRGSGKSTLAKSLSAKTGLACIDLDSRTASLLDRPTVAQAWTDLGEETFRATELRALREALADRTPIIALGGGTPTAPGAADLLRTVKRARPPRIIYLRAAPEVLAARMRRSPARPSLTGADPIAEVPVIFAKRDPLYLDLADTVVEVDTLSPDQTVALLLRLTS